MQISALYQDLIKMLVSEITSETMQNLNLGDLLTARVKAVDGDTVMLRIQGRDIPATTLIPLEIGATLNFQYQGIQDGKVIFRLIDNNPPQKESEFVTRILQSFDLPDTATNREIVNQMISQQMPLDKKDLIQLGNLVKSLQIPTEDIEPALFLYRQNMPPTPANINMLREFQNSGLNLFQGQNEIEKLVTDSLSLAPALKDEITSLVNKISSFQITKEDSSSEISTKLSQAPSFIISQPEGQELTSAPSENNPYPPLANKTEIIITNQQGASEQAGTVQKDSSPALPLNTENLLSRLEILAGKFMGDHQKLNLFLKNIRDAIQPQKEEIRELLNKISARLDSAKPEEHAIREIIKDISNRFEFMEQLIQRAPNNNNQQIVFYSQVILKDNNNQEKPVTITIKQSKNQKDKKINFDNCTLSISLQTQNLSLIKANVKKSARKLTCQLLVDNEKAKNILEPVLSELTDALEKLNFSVSIKPIIIETFVPKEKSPVGQDISSNLFNIDIRI